MPDGSGIAPHPFRLARVYVCLVARIAPSAGCALQKRQTPPKALGVDEFAIPLLHAEEGSTDLRFLERRRPHHRTFWLYVVCAL
jgi:hypothetical protein